MRVHSLVLLAVPWFGGSHHGQTADQLLKWTRENIDAHAVMHFSSPPHVTSETRWTVENISGCKIELKQTWRRDSQSEDLPDGLTGKSTMWDFSLNDLLPANISADTSVGVPHVTIFAPGDAFHLKTEFVSPSRSWSLTGSERNLWMYFDSPDADNNILVTQVAQHLRAATELCISHHK